METTLGRQPRLRLDLVPACVFTWPEVASVGLGEEAARSQGREVVVGRFPFSANGRATAEGEREGFVKVVAEAGTGRADVIVAVTGDVHPGPRGGPGHRGGIWPRRHR